MTPYEFLQKVPGVELDAHDRFKFSKNSGNDEWMKATFSNAQNRLTKKIDFSIAKAHCEKPRTNGSMNKLQPEDQPVHDWYRFVLSFLPHLVNDYIKKFHLQPNQTLLDPFCGTGTTLVEAKMLGIPSVGIEANPMAHFASQVKLDWNISPQGLLQHADFVASRATLKLEAIGIEDDPIFNITVNKKLELRKLGPEQIKLLLKDSISPLPLHKTLILLETLRQYQDGEYHRHELLALAKALVFSISNLRFGPEVGIGKLKSDAPVVSVWLTEVKKMATALERLDHSKNTFAEVHLADSRQLTHILKPNSIDAVITSPPYPNEKDYTRTTRLESVLLGFINNAAELKALKQIWCARIHAPFIKPMLMMIESLITRKSSALPPTSNNAVLSWARLRISSGFMRKWRNFILAA
jgi:hypothetical protein